MPSSGHDVSFNCQKCKQPLRLDESLSDLSPSAYDMITSTVPERWNSRYTPDPERLSRLPPSVRNAYLLGPNHPASQPISRRIVGPRIPPSRPPNESFVVLSDSQVRPSQQRVTEGANDSRPSPPAETRHTGLSVKDGPDSNSLQLSLKLFNLLSAQTEIDHPLCTECTETLTRMMEKQLGDLSKENERYATMEKELNKSMSEKVDDKEKVKLEQNLNEVGDVFRYYNDVGEGLKGRDRQLRKTEKSAIAELKAVEHERADLAKELAELDREEEELAAEEAQFWRDYNTYSLDLEAHKSRARSIQARYEHDLRELEKLSKTNVYNDSFCIGLDGVLGTINGLRLGRAPGVQVGWPEINAAWGHTLLALSTIARKLDFTFSTYRLIPMGSFSRIERIAGNDKTVFELYGSGEFAFGRLIQNWRFDSAMVVFLDCFRQLIDSVQARDPEVHMPFPIEKEKIGNISIKLQFSTDEVWTKALRHVLMNLKRLLAYASESAV